MFDYLVSDVRHMKRKVDDMSKKMIPAIDAEGKAILNEDGTPKMIEAPDEQDPPAESLVSREAYDRVKKDMHDYKTRNSDLQKQIENMKVQVHKEKEDWKSVSEHHESRAKELETQLTGLKSGLISTEKTRKLTEEAVKHGINPASIPDLELLDFEELTVETTSTGKILVSGADRAIAKLKVIRPHWFNKSVTSVNPATPNVGQPIGGAVTIADLNAAEAQWKKTQSTVDKEAYYNMIQKYKTQTG